MLKFKKGSDNYGDFAGDERYYGGNGFDDVDVNETEEDGFGMGLQNPAPAAPAEPTPAFGSSAAPALKIVNPKEYKDAMEIANLLMNGNTVLLNIESIAKDQAIRLLDYLAGAVHVAGGLMTKVSKTTIVIAPKNIDVSSIEAMVSGN